MSFQKPIIPLLLIFLFVIPSVFADLRPELAVNDELRICKTYNPSGLYDLPQGWMYYEAQGDFMISQHKSTCESLGYAYSNERLEGVMKPYYQNWSSILNLGVIVLFIIGYLFIFRIYKSKKKKLKSNDYITFGLICLILLVVLIILRFIAWGFVYPCAYIAC